MKNFISLIFLTFTMFVFAQEAPVANDQSVSINEGDTTNGNLTGSDADGEGRDRDDGLPPLYASPL